MKFSFFDWIREGVKQSVLLGLSDAAEHIGTPAESDQLNKRILSSFENGRLLSNQANSSKNPRSRRKALGRSLSTIIDDESSSS